MVAAGAFAVRGFDNAAEDIRRLELAHGHVRALLKAPDERAVGRACAALCREGVSEERLTRLLTALAGRQAALAEKKAGEGARVAAPASVAMTREAHAQVHARLPYKDD